MNILYISKEFLWRAAFKEENHRNVLILIFESNVFSWTTGRFRPDENGTNRIYHRFATARGWRWLRVQAATVLGIDVHARNEPGYISNSFR